MRRHRYKLATAFFRAGNLWESSCQLSEGVEDMVKHKMSLHSFIELALMLLIVLLWCHNQKMHEETEEWKAMAEEYFKR